jgi:RNA chaperone Hfq
MGVNSMNVQDVYLNKLRRSEALTEIDLIDGTQRTGKVVVFDAVVVLLQIQNKEIMLYKNNIIGVNPLPSDFRVFSDDQKPDWAKHHVYGPEQKGETPEGGLTLGEKGTYRMPILKGPHEPNYPS